MCVFTGYSILVWHVNMRKHRVHKFHHVSNFHLHSGFHHVLLINCGVMCVYYALTERTFGNSILSLKCKIVLGVLTERKTDFNEKSNSIIFTLNTLNIYFLKGKYAVS